MLTREEAVRAGVALDATYMRRLFIEMHSLPDSLRTSIGGLCVAPFISLVIHEARAKSQYLPMGDALALSGDAEEICSRARHSLKFFTDKKKSIDEHLATFDRIRKEHSDYFLGNTWLPLARFLESDLGIFTYDGKVINTSHSAAFHSGIGPGQLLQENRGPYIRSTMEQFGRCLSLLGGDEESAAAPLTFISHVSEARIRNRDVRASRHYTQGFNGPRTPQLNGMLTDFQAILNFATSIVSAGGDPLSLEYTAFKIRYVALYHTLASLDDLRKDSDSNLTQRSSRAIEKILESNAATVVMDPSLRQLRNILVHYAPNPEALQEMDLDQPLFGLVPIFLPTHNFRSFSTILERCCQETSQEMNRWAKAR
ncbi:hypothetical protein ACIGG5_11855 [Streptomyces sp. NPDC085463]|uniref:hypothetical protein n=1 Tax=Streptomyces sp. NPDC085463 TaxID=3365724 RepID=UPI0037D03F50